MIFEGLKFMVIGMSVVFAFLSLLVLAMNLSASFFTKFAHLFPEEKEPTAGLQRRGGDDHADIAVAIAAVRAYTRS